MQTDFSDLRRRLNKLQGGAPVGTLSYKGGKHAVDERGVFYRVQSLEEIERRRMFMQRAEGRKAAFTFNGMNMMKYVGSVLSAAQCGYLLTLSTYVNYSGQLVRSERDHSPIKQVHMIELLGLKPSQKSTVSDFVAAALNYGIMTFDGSHYSIANELHFKGKAEGDVVRAYVTQLRSLAQNNKPEHIGFIYKLLPYVHKTSNVLCSDPNELDFTRIQRLTRNELAAAANVKPTYVSKAAKAMTVDGLSVLAKITTAQGTFYMLNPTLFRRADVNEYDAATRAIFGL